MNFTLEQEPAVIAHNGENADMSNPKGEVYGEINFIVGVNEVGTRIENSTVVYTTNDRVVDVGNAEDYDCPFVYTIPEQTRTVEQLRQLVERLNATQPKLNMEHWRETYPVYGSPAWEDEQADLYHESIRELEEAW